MGAVEELGFFHKTGDKTGVIFTSVIIGGHEIMTLAIIDKIINENPECLLTIKLYIPAENSALINLVKKKGYHYELYSIAHRRMEILHAFMNVKFIGECIKLLKSIKNETDRILLIQGDIQQGSGFITAGKIAKIPLVSYIPFAHSYKVMNSPGHKAKDFLAKFTYKMCDEYITISPCFEDDLRKLNAKAKVDVIKNSVPKTLQKHIPRKLTPDDVINIFIIGRVHILQKGHDILIDALAGIQDYKVCLNVVGDGPDKETVIASAKQLPDNITFKWFGWIEDCWSVADDADLLVIPSRFEGVPLVMLEALERKLPVIAVSRDGMRDYLPSDWLYSAGDNESEALKLKLAEIFLKLTSLENRN
ncbi:UDP-D-galactose:(glucosyl)lipopolysaccharide-1,6-D-galactosyltransferase [compost metagenome]